MTGLRNGRTPRLVKQYADMHGLLRRAAKNFADEAKTRVFPGPEHAFDDQKR
ncbi:hypothetical protein K5Q02_13090 [Pseudomonas sp. MM211]|uniref:hypothetical protein n=1 Tax=Pseudomonas sp. MM211 TaxID=2866808 RepID=UPI003FA717EA|nr:hypothetical protein K5Q02_13090 [Pseudomonas sp. MM211]